MAFVALDQLINLHDGYRQQFVVERREYLLIQEHGQVYLLQASCPHLHWPLLSASIHAGNIYCSKHGMAFDLATGQPANERALGCKPLQIFTPAYEGIYIGLWLDSK